MGFLGAMNLDQYKLICEKAIRANFVTRNTRVFGVHRWQMRVRRERGDIIRKWIAQLRLSRDPQTCEQIALEVSWKRV